MKREQLKFARPLMTKLVNFFPSVDLHFMYLKNCKQKTSDYAPKTEPTVQYQDLCTFNFIFRWAITSVQTQICEIWTVKTPSML